ncbi:transposase [Streptomyces sp. NPDC127178]|uniref:transposase n=1 Tax=unclassified Streptomyces TaxID=2593676 RepID=UPI00362E3243
MRRRAGVGIDGAGGLLQQMMKAVLERALQVEMADHLGYEVGEPARRGSGNVRNGTYPETLTTVSGPVTVDVPRDRK